MVVILSCKCCWRNPSSCLSSSTAAASLIWPLRASALTSRHPVVVVALDLVCACPCAKVRVEACGCFDEAQAICSTTLPSRGDFDSCSMDTTTCFPKLEFRLRLHR